VANNVNVVNRGFEYICQMLAGNISTFSIPTYIGWGGANGYNASSTTLPGAAPTTTLGTGQWSDVAPFQEFSEARVKASSTAITSNTAASGTVSTQYVGTITASTGESVGESFLAPTATKPSAYTLNSNVTSIATAFTVTTGTLANGYYQMNNEVVQITGVTGNTVASTVVRGTNGSTAGTAKTNDIITFGNIPGAGASNPSNGDMFAHAGFQALALNTSDSIQFTWNVSITS
jgi:hypothetical protein